MRDERESELKEKKKSDFLLRIRKKAMKKSLVLLFLLYTYVDERESKESNSTRKKYAFRHAYLDSSNKLPKKSRAKAKTRRKIRRAKVFFLSFPFFSFFNFSETTALAHNSSSEEKEPREGREESSDTNAEKIARA